MRQIHWLVCKTSLKNTLNEDNGKLNGVVFLLHDGKVTVIGHYMKQLYYCSIAKSAICI